MESLQKYSGCAEEPFLRKCLGVTGPSAREIGCHNAGRRSRGRSTLDDFLGLGTSSGDAADGPKVLIHGTALPPISTTSSQPSFAKLEQVFYLEGMRAP